MAKLSYFYPFFAILVLLVCSSPCRAANLLIDSMQYSSAVSAQLAWTEPFSDAALPAVPADVDNLDALAFPCAFTNSTLRGTWDKSVNLDLSTYDYFTFQFKADAPAAIGYVSLGFLTGSGGWWGYDGAVYTPDNMWQTGFARRSDFTCEGICDGWNDITRVRISVWRSNGAYLTTNTYIANLYTGQVADQNLVRNGGFEEVTTAGLPDFWGTGNWGLSKETWVTGTDAWRARWGIDTSVSHTGSRSLRIVGSTDATELWAMSNNIDLQAGNTYTLSAWMKSDSSTGLPVYMGMTWFASQQVTVGNTWQRYVLGPTVPPGAANTLVPSSVLIFPNGNGTLWLDDVKLEANDTATDYSPAIEDRAFSIQTVHRVPPSLSNIAISPGPGSLSVSIDSHRRFLVNEKPFIPFAIGWGNIPTAKEFNYFASAGFNTVCFVADPSQTISALQTALDNAQANGLKVILWIDNAVPLSTLQTWASALRDHPALVAWYIYDELTSITPDVQAKYDTVKQIDPGRPAYINYWATPLPLGDIASIDNYAISGQHPPAMEALNADVLETFAASSGKPGWLWLQDTGYAYSWSREPTGPEMETMVYLALIHGVRGIKLFANMPHSKELWNELRMLSREVSFLTPVLYSLEIPRPASATLPAIHLASKTYNKTQFIISANGSMAPATVTFNVPGGSTATVLFENRLLTIKNNQFTDNFAAYQRHVYQIN